MQKTVLITGATSGIGKSAAKLFLEKGWLVYAVGRNSDALVELEKSGAIPLLMDVTKQEEIDKAFLIIENNSHKIDVLVNNAGYGQFGPIEEVTYNKALEQFETNVFGLAEVCKRALPCMRKNKSGRIINVSSIAGRISIPGGGWYAASKHAVEALSDALRWELKQFGIKVSVIQPGPIKTAFSDNVNKNRIPSKPDSPYGDMTQKLTDIGAKSPGAPVKAVAKKIYRAAISKNPKNRYIITKEAKIIRIALKILPPKLMDYFIVKALK
jgi:short-subunit dehydrogenase